MTDLFNWTPSKYPEHPGFKTGGTSREAAVKTAPRAPTMRDQVLIALRDVWPAGLTADEVAAVLGRSQFAIRPRLSELKDMGKIAATETRRKNDSGLSATVWIWMKP
jgi:predicted ArsR family transcriptional regulator